jgi:hypothetical protein
LVTAQTIQSLAARLEKATALVRDGAVFPVAGLDGYSVVRNGGNSMYLVRYDAGHEHCTCADFQQRQRAASLPCKHLLAAELAAGGNTQPPAPALLSTEARSKATALVMGRAA